MPLPAMSPINPRTQSTSALTKPWGLFLPSTPRTGSVPIVGRTLSPADKLTKSAKGINQTHMPK